MKPRQVMLIALLYFFPFCSAFAGWTLYEETNVKGKIGGTIKKGAIISMQSGSIYEVTDFTMQVVLELSPEALILVDGSQYKLSIKGFQEPLICKQLTSPKGIKTEARSAAAVVPPVKLPSSEEVPLEKLIPPSAQKGMGINKLSPEERENLRQQMLQIYLQGVRDGQAPTAGATAANAVRESALESSVDGEFNGWEGETIIKLTNGQIWQQTEYHYNYHYAYMPKAIVYKSGTGYKMKVEGSDQSVGVTRLK